MPEDVSILLLDVMSTIVHDPFTRELPAFFDMTFEELLEAKHPEAWIEFERSEIDEPEFLEKFFLDDRSVDREALHAHLREAYAFKDGMESLLADLADADVEMHALSNYSPWWQLIEDELELSRFLEWSFVSCKTGYRKPAAESYLNAVRSLDAEPWDCVFVDDRELNCNSARAMGLEVIRFQGAEALREELERYFAV